MKTKGDLITEDEVAKRICEAVMQLVVVEGDVTHAMQLHNELCEGEITLYQSEGGEPLDIRGQVIDGESPAQSHDGFVYLFTEGEDD